MLLLFLQGDGPFCVVSTGKNIEVVFGLDADQSSEDAKRYFVASWSPRALCTRRLCQAEDSFGFVLVNTVNESQTTPSLSFARGQVNGMEGLGRW